MERVELMNLYPHDYTREAAYASYLNQKIYNEQKLNIEISKLLSLSKQDSMLESTINNIVAVHEAKIGDNVKTKWNKFLDFIKNLWGKFMENMSNLFLDEKKYLDKYRDIILKKRPNEVEFSYEGNYDIGIQRIVQIELKQFRPEFLDKQGFLSDDQETVQNAVVKELTSGMQGFTYDSNLTLEEQFKDFFCAKDKGLRQGTLADLNRTDMFNFCYNYKRIQEVTKKDISRLESSSKAINKAIDDGVAELNKGVRQNQTQTQTTTNTNPTQNNQNNNQGTGSNQPNVTDQTDTVKVSQTRKSSIENRNKALANNTEESMFVFGNYDIFKEDGQEQESKPGEINSVKIDMPKNSNAASLSGSYSGDDKNGPTDADKEAAKNYGANAATGKSDEDTAKYMTQVSTAITTWTNVSRAIITSKWTIAEFIYKEYMKLIRAHVKSYVGKTNDTLDDTQEQIATDYNKYKNDNQGEQNNQTQEQQPPTNNKQQKKQEKVNVQKNQSPINNINGKKPQRK